VENLTGSSPLGHLNNKLMNRKSRTVLTGALVALACVSVPPVAGQEKAMMKMNASEVAIERGVELRSWQPVLADSSITYNVFYIN
jgi:hypothetical protein